MQFKMPDFLFTIKAGTADLASEPILPRKGKGQVKVKGTRYQVFIAWLWQDAGYTNLKIGDLFGLAHASISRRVTIVRNKMRL